MQVQIVHVSQALGMEVSGKGGNETKKTGRGRKMGWREGGQ
jgi:hypothetical protein